MLRGLHMTRRDWWLAIGILSLAIGLHALLPRYEWRQEGRAFVRIDQWTGRAELGSFVSDGRWASVASQLAWKRAVEAQAARDRQAFEDDLADIVKKHGGVIEPAP